MKTIRNRIPQLLVALLTLLLLTPKNMACVQPVPVPDFWCKDGQELRALLTGLDCPQIEACIRRAGAEGKSLGGIGIEINLFGASNTQCACGVSLGNCPPGLNLEVCAISILVVNKETHEIIGKSTDMVFDRNAATKASLEGVFGGNWSGFFANVPQINPIDLQEPLVYKLWLTTLSDLPISKFKDQCRLRIASGEGNPNGTIQTEGEHPVVPLYEIPLDGSAIVQGFDPANGDPRPGNEPQITSVNRVEGGEGDLLVIRGRGFGEDPDDLCMVVAAPQGGGITPLEAVQVRDDRIVAKVNFVRDNALAGRIMIERGKGGRFVCDLADKTDCKIVGPPWCWKPHDFPAPPAVAEENFQPIPPGDDPNVCRFPGTVSEGMICTIIDGEFPAGSKVQIYARARDGDNQGKDLGNMCLFCVVPRTAAEMAACIKDFVKCAFADGGNEIVITCDELANGGVKITLKSIDGQPIAWGGLNIAIRKGLVGVPQIEQVIPRGGGQQGDLVIIRGRGFGEDPDDLCMVTRVGDGAVGFQVVAVEDDRILARIEDVPDQLVADQLMMQVGEGHRGPVVFAFDDMQLEEPMWAWEGLGDFGVAQPLPGADFDLLPTQPRPFDICYREQLVDGKLCTIIGPDPWQPGYRVQIFTRAHTACEKVDIRVPFTRFINGGTAEDCARRIKDMLGCAFRQQTGALMNFTCTTLQDGRVKITAERADGMPITWGMMKICVRCPVPIPDIDDDGIELGNPVRDGIVKIPGVGFGDNPDDLCVVVCNPGIMIPLDVQTVTDTLICARIGPIPPDVVPGPIMVMRGRGRQGPMVPAPQFADLVTPRDDAWLWQPDDGIPVAVTNRDYILIPEPAARSRCFFGRNVDGQICTIIEGDWVPGTALDIRIRAHNKEKGRFLDLGTRSITLTRQGTLQDCAARIKDFGLCLQQQQANIPPNERIDIKCEPLEEGQIKMILCYQDGCPIEKGTFNIWAQIKGDMNDDGQRDAFDIQQYVNALTDPIQFRTDTGVDPGIFGDLDNDGLISGFDIDPFVGLLSGQGVPPAAIRSLRALIPGEDLDGDGFTNDSEAFAGTDPDNASDFLRIFSQARRANTLGISWTSVPGKHYQLEYNEHLSNTTWKVVNTAPIVAEGLESSFVDTDPDRALSACGFYRIRVISPQN